MKKLLSIVFACVFVISITGCTKKEKMRCAMELETEKYIITGIIENDKVTSIVSEEIYVYTDEKDVKEQYEYWKNHYTDYDYLLKGESVDVKKENMSVVVTSTYDLKKMNSEDIIDIFETESFTKEEFKKWNESYYFICE